VSRVTLIVDEKEGDVVQKKKIVTSEMHQSSTVKGNKIYTDHIDKHVKNKAT